MRKMFLTSLFFYFFLQYCIAIQCIPELQYKQIAWYKGYIPSDSCLNGPPNIGFHDIRLATVDLANEAFLIDIPQNDIRENLVKITRSTDCQLNNKEDIWTPADSIIFKNNFSSLYERYLEFIPTPFFNIPKQGRSIYMLTDFVKSSLKEYEKNVIDFKIFEFIKHNDFINYCINNSNKFFLVCSRSSKCRRNIGENENSFSSVIYPDSIYKNYIESISLNMVEITFEVKPNMNFPEDDLFGKLIILNNKNEAGKQVEVSINSYTLNIELEPRDYDVFWKDENTKFHIQTDVIEVKKCDLKGISIVLIPIKEEVEFQIKTLNSINVNLSKINKMIILPLDDFNGSGENVNVTSNSEIIPKLRHGRYKINFSFNDSPQDLTYMFYPFIINVDKDLNIVETFLDQTNQKVINTLLTYEDLVDVDIDCDHGYGLIFLAFKTDETSRFTISWKCKRITYFNDNIIPLSTGPGYFDIKSTSYVYMDRLVSICPDNKVLSSWKLVKYYKSAIDRDYDAIGTNYKCSTSSQPLTCIDESTEVNLFNSDELTKLAPMKIELKDSFIGSFALKDVYYINRPNHQFTQIYKYASCK